MSNIFRVGRPTNFKLGTQTQHEDPHQRQAPWPSRSKVKYARSRDASDRCWPISRERNGQGRPKLVGRLSTPLAIMRPRFRIKGQRSRSPGRLMLRPEVRHIFRTGRPTNFKVGTQMEQEDPHQRQALWSPRSKVKITRSTNAEIGSASYLPNGKAYEFQTWYTDGVRTPVSPTSAVTRPITAETETVSYLLNGKTY